MEGTRHTALASSDSIFFLGMLRLSMLLTIESGQMRVAFSFKCVSSCATHLGSQMPL